MTRRGFLFFLLLLVRLKEYIDRPRGVRVGLDLAKSEDVTVHEMWKRGPDGRMAFYAYKVGDNHWRMCSPYHPDAQQVEWRKVRI